MNDMFNITLDLPDELATERFSQQLAQHIKAGDVIFLRGDLGAGKTTFSRYFARALGVQGRIKSPTYTLVESYDLLKMHDVKVLHHFDLYRLSDPREWFSAGFDEYLNQHSIVLIEWPSKAEGALPEPRLTLTFEHVDDFSRVGIESFDGGRRVVIAGTKSWSNLDFDKVTII